MDVAFDAWPKPDVGQKQSAGMVDDFAALQTRRAKADADITVWANRVDDAWLADDLVWFSGSAAGRCGDRRDRWWCTSSITRRITAARRMRCSPPVVRTPATPICSWWCPTA